MNEFTIRNMIAADIDSIFNIEAECYTKELAESKDVIKNKFRLSSKTCWAAMCEKKLIAYLLCHPYIAESIPQLNSILESIPTLPTLKSKYFYIHSLTVSKEAQKSGIAKALIEKAFKFVYKNDFSSIGLVSVQGSHSFWERFGFKIKDVYAGDNVNNLLTYGSAAKYMMLEM